MMISLALKFRTSNLRDSHWLILYGLILASWMILFGLHVSAADLNGIRTYGLDYFLEICAIGPEQSSFLIVFGMWTAMAAAMMLPGFVPALGTYEGFLESGIGSQSGFLQLVGGYLGAWIAFSFAAASLQFVLQWGSADLLSSDGAYREFWLAALFAVAGAYQFLPLKNNCLDKCRHPFAVFFEHWGGERWNAMFIGFRLGLYCVGCCWALMTLALAGGVVSVAWMGIGTLLMTIEKFDRVGRLISKPLGIALLAAAFKIATMGA